jgi:tRNA nucleotidyltransferase (CCA-adding enzyme)
LHPASFIDDPTRILRAIRYEHRYGFKIDTDTLKYINQESLGVLSKLSGERIRHEFDLIFEEESPAPMLLRADELALFSTFKPELPKLNEKYESLFNSAPEGDFGIAGNRVFLGYLLWFMDSAIEDVNTFAKRLDFTAELTQMAVSAIELKNELSKLAGSKPSIWTARLDKVPLMAIYALWLATNETALKEFLVKWRKINPKTTGDDLKALRIPPGPRYKEILSHLRTALLDGEVHNEKEEKDLLNTLL